jgi:hypothetical protein
VKGDADIPSSRVAAFVRQHAHDVRNRLNALELESALLTELVADPEARACVDRIRAQLRETAADLKVLAEYFAPPEPERMPFAAADLFATWQEHAVRLGVGVEWSGGFGGENVEVDPNMLSGVLEEWLLNAGRFGAGQACAGRGAIEEGQVVFELREPLAAAVDPSPWGRTPFQSVERGHYGLGLWSADRAAVANGGTITREVQDGALVTRLALPLA